MKEYEIRKAELGDESILAYIQSESWKCAYKGILSDEDLERATNIERTKSTYQKLLNNKIGSGYILFLRENPHCIAWWGKCRTIGMEEYAELYCIHSIPTNWRQGYGRKMMEIVLSDVQKNGYKKIMLWVFEDNLKARKFYEALGFCTYNKIKPEIVPKEICYELELI